jgi:hypothetical protein
MRWGRSLKWKVMLQIKPSGWLVRQALFSACADDQPEIAGEKSSPDIEHILELGQGSGGVM